MNTLAKTTSSRERRRAKIRSRVSGTPQMPRLSVFKSNKHMSAQLIDDVNAVTLASAHSKDISKGTLLEKSEALGHAVALQAKAKKITTVVFDRGGFMYTGCVKAVAEGARAGGLKF